MMNKMIVSNLAHRPLRSAISVVAIALEVTLILLIVGFALGMLHDSRSRQAGIGADHDLRGNADGLGLLLNDSTGANVVTGVNNAVVLDNGAFDCDGDGGVDSNIITGGVAHRGPPPPDTLSSSTRSRGSIVLQ